jgi:hypothetical protein
MASKSLKNVLRGAGSSLEIQPAHKRGPRLYHPARTDVDALRGDWMRVGNDLKRALDRVAYDEKVK